KLLPRPNSFWWRNPPPLKANLELLPELMAANIASVKIEGRQRSPAYVTQVAKVWRQAIDRCKADPQNFVPQSAWMETLGAMSEGTQTTLGAYHRKWQ
ncbi:peptidase U32 family protein, partial [Klebsiella pneumoniae]|uniref:peptidase U32 family protein n=1 Tax=Klebsiella pneumoniae TaxID=573 RepID=UPI003968C7FA